MTQGEQTQRAAFEALLEEINWLGYSIAAPAFRHGRAKEVIVALRAAQTQRAPEPWRAQLEALVDIWEDGTTSAPGDGCYAPGALREVMLKSKAMLAASPTPETPR